MSVAAIRRAGERAVLLDVRSPPASVAAAVRRLAEERSLALTDVVPGAETVLVVATDAGELARLVAALPTLVVADGAETVLGDPVEIPVRYDGADLAAVAATVGLDVAEVVRRHSSASYRAAFTGFAPGFAYLTGLDPILRMPRRSSPRATVPAGSVAIAAAYTAVYPRASPGGWHLLATTDAVVFDPDRRSPALIAPGADVRLVVQPGPTA